MNVRRRAARAVALAACAALLVVGWTFFAPRQLGGHASYVTTSGTSMEPGIHRGDVVIVRSLPEYPVGTVVAYRNPDVGQVVLHRIVGLEEDRFVLKGDNNDWFDSYQPSPDEILGAMAFRLPGAGRPLGAVRTPWGMSALVSVAALALFGGRRRLRHREAQGSAERGDAPAVRSRNGRTPAPPHRGSSVPAGVVAGLAAVAALSLAIVAVVSVLSPTVSTEHDVTYDQQGTFSYTGPLSAEGREVYGRATIETGDPVYRELTRRIEVAFDYTLTSAAVLDASGTVGLVLEVSDVNGWIRTYELAPTISFTGSEVRAEGEVDIVALAAMTRQLERVTGVDRDHYTVAVRPEVAVEGSLAGRPLTETFDPELRFVLDPLQMHLEPAGTAPVGDESADPLNPASGGLLKTHTDEPRTFAVFGLELRPEPVRAAAAATFLISAIGLLIIAIRRHRSARRGEVAAIESRYGQFLVPVHTGTGSGPSAGRTVQVESFDSLVRLANHYGHVVLHEEADGRHAYFVEENGVTYRYLTANGSHR